MANNFADTNRSVLHMLPETQWGQTPTTGSPRELRMTSHSIATKKNTTISNEIRDDRMVSDIIETDMMSDGGINGEFSAFSYDDLFQAFVLGTWTTTMHGDMFQGPAVSWIAGSIITIASSTDLTRYFTVGQGLKTNGFVNPTNNGFWQISTVSYVSASSLMELTVTGPLVPVAEAGNVHSMVSDANDVIVLGNTHIRAGTGGANTFDSNATNAFASAITAGLISQYQKIHVEGLGYDHGTVTFTAPPTVGDSFRINDGVNVYTFVAGTDFQPGATLSVAATNLALAINEARVFGVSSPTFTLAINATVSAGVVTLKNLNKTGGTITVTSTAASAGAFAGGSASATGVFTLLNLTNDVLTTVEPVTLDANAGTYPITIRSSMLRNPSNPAQIIPQSFSIESGYEDVLQSFTQNGVRISAFSLDFNASTVLTCTFELMGRQTTANSGSLPMTQAPYTPKATTATEVMNATTDVGSLLVDGLPLTTAIKQIKMDGKAELRNQMAVGSKFPVGIVAGRFELTGTATAYFETLQMFNYFLNHSTVALAFSAADNLNNTYYWTIPAIKLTADPITTKGVNQDVMEDITWSAFRDPVTNCMMQIDRFSSLIPV